MPAVRPMSLCAVALLAAAFSATPGHRLARGDGPPAGGVQRALLIGVDRYAPNSGLRDLAFPGRDVGELADVLRAAGYDVTLLATGGRAPTGKAIRDEFQALKAKWKPGDTLVVAFAGHGTQPDKTFYFCPADARLDDVKTLVSIDELFDQMKACEGGFKLLLADACRDRPPELSRSRQVDDLASKTRPRQALPTPPGNVAAFYSCSAGEQAFEHPSLKHGVFFHYVIEGLRGKADFNGSGEVTVPKLQEYVQKEVGSFVGRKIGRVQRPDVESKSNENKPIVRLRAAAVPPPSAPAEDATFWLDEGFQRVAAGKLPAGWEGDGYEVALSNHGHNYMKSAKEGGGVVRLPLPAADLGTFFFVETEVALGPGQQFELQLVGRGTPGVSLRVSSTGTASFSGTNERNLRGFRAGERNRLRVMRAGDRFGLAVNDEGDWDSAYTARLPRQFSGVAIGLTGATTGVRGGMPPGDRPNFGGKKGDGPGKKGGSKKGDNNKAGARSASSPATEWGVYSVRVGPLDRAANDPEPAAPPKVAREALNLDLARSPGRLPPGWDAKDFEVLPDDHGRKALQVNVKNAGDVTAEAAAEALGGGLSGDFFLECEFVLATAPNAEVVLALDGMAQPLHLSPGGVAFGDRGRGPGMRSMGGPGGAAGPRVEAGHTHRLFLSRTGTTYRAVLDDADANAAELTARDAPPIKALRLTVKGAARGGPGVRAGAGVTCVYAVRGGELAGPAGAPAPAATRGPDDFGTVRDGALPPGWTLDFGKAGVRSEKGRKLLAPTEAGTATLTPPAVDLKGNFSLECEYCVAPGGHFRLRLSEGTHATAKRFEISVDGDRGTIGVSTHPPVPNLKPGAVKLNKGGSNVLRLSRSGQVITIAFDDAKGTVRDYPKVEFDAIQLTLSEPPRRGGGAATGVFRLSVKEKEK